ncbi:auxin efflux carrier [Tanacetum coccineum]
MGLIQILTNSFVYAANTGLERKILWRDLKAAKTIINDHPWMLAGHFNVTLKVEEHSASGSNMTSDMQEFKDCVNEIEVEDICSYDMFYTWIKSPQKRVVKKLKASKSPMNKLNWKNGNLCENRKEAECLAKYMEAVIEEEKLLFQRAKIDCFLGTVDNVNPIFDAKSMFSNKLEENKGMEMISEVTDLEIKNVVFDIRDAKAPRPDGFTFAFFKNSWKIIGKDVCSAVRDFFNNGKLLGEVNATLISLVPKVTQPSKISEFRPIVCCNVLYKCISKILTNRIKPGLNKLVNQNQSAFVPGRLNQDNLLLSQELLKGYNCKNGPKRCALKVDIAKAYDNVNWGFLENILNQFGFHEKMIGKLPVKYLGIPILSKKVGINDCKILVDRVRNKVNYWKNKVLSYADKIQLIASVLSVMQSYWACAKVARSVICCPKSKSRLGLKLLDKWNEVLLIKHIWKLVSNQEGLWVKWVNRVKLKGKSLWEVSAEYNDSGTWKALFDMRDKVRPYIVNVLGDDSKTSMWRDNWNVVGPLSKVINSRSLYDARLSNACTVKDMIKDNRWIWPSEWQNQFPILNQVDVSSLHTRRSDMVKWKSKSVKRMVFFVNEAWKDLKDELPLKVMILIIFKCEFSAPIWDAAKRKMKAANATNEWDQIVQAMGVFGIECSMGVIEMVGSQVVWDDAFYGCHCLPILFKSISLSSRGNVVAVFLIFESMRPNRYVVPTGKDNFIVSAGRPNMVPAGRTIVSLGSIIFGPGG